MFGESMTSENQDILILEDNQIDLVAGGVAPIIGFLAWNAARHAVVTYGPAVVSGAVRVAGATAAAYALGEAAAGMYH